MIHKKKHYDILIVGGGLTGAMIAYKNRGKSVLVLEKKENIGGFCSTEEKDNIMIHKYGPHIFHTNKKEVWDFVNSITPFNPFLFNVKACYKDKIYSLPFNMNTFNLIWGCTTIEQAKECVEKDWDTVINILIKGYSEKLWNKPFDLIPIEIIKRIPVRFTWNNNYFNDKYVGIPVYGYSIFIKKLMEDAEILYNTNFLENKEYWESIADEIYYTGPIDEYYNYCFGALEWRSVCHEHIKYDIEDFQGCAQMNYTDSAVPYTRIIEHKHFMPEISTKCTWISKEYPSSEGDKAYPVNDEININLYNKYKSIPNKVVFCGRLGEYRYYNMNDIIEKYI